MRLVLRRTLLFIVPMILAAVYLTAAVGLFGK